MYMIKVRKVLCYFSGLVLTLAGIPFITEFIFESQGGQQVQYISIYPVIGGILMGFGILVCYLAYRSGNKAEIIPPSKWSRKGGMQIPRVRAKNTSNIARDCDTQVRWDKKLIRRKVSIDGGILRTVKIMFIELNWILFATAQSLTLFFSKPEFVHRIYHYYRRKKGFVHKIPPCQN